MRKLKNRELNRKNIDQFKEAKKTPLIVILDNIRSLNNIGSVLRTSDAFLVEKIYLCGITATPPHKDIHKTALGATDSVEWEYSEETIYIVEKLKSENVEIISIEQAENAIMLDDFKADKDKRYAIIFGNEVKGVEQKIVSASDSVIEIPQHGTKHSLNIVFSAGVVIWEIFKQLN